MNCQEVMELMQRHLDLDLNEEEQNLLEQHIAGCSSCQEMMGRLQRLTDELTNLPKVYPPVSLVDAIMPKLIEIDNQSYAGSDRSQYNDAQTLSDKKLPRPRRISYRVVGGVVAASLLLGILIVNWDDLKPPQRMQANDSATVKIAFSHDAEAAHDTAYDDVASGSELSAGSTAFHAEKETAESMTDRNLQYQAQQYDGGDRHTEVSRAPSGMHDNSGVDTRAPEESQDRLTVQGEERDIGKDMSADQGSLHHLDHSSDAAKVEQAGVQLQYSEVFEQVGLVSPSGNLLAYIDNGSIVIVNTDQEKVYTSRSYSDEVIGSLQWQDDNRITFELGADSDQVYFIDLANHEEGVLDTP